VAVPTLTVLLFGLSTLVLKADTERRRAQQLALHLESFLPASLAREIAYQAPNDESLGKLCQGVLLSVRVHGLERWTSSVDSLQALGLAHAISTMADHVASANAGELEHVHGEILLIAWPQINAQSANAAIQTARQLLQKLEPLLRQNESVRYPISLQAAIESGAFLLGLAGPQSSRRLLLLGPVADIAQAILPFCEELAAPILIGPQLAQLQTAEKLVVMGKFLLPDQAQPKTLYRVVL
jgi:class 3 adenylate cyclase